MAQDKPEIAFVVNGPSDFWKLAEAGVNKAQTELPNYDLQFKYPEQAAAAVQHRLEGVLDAVAVLQRCFDVRPDRGVDDGYKEFEVTAIKGRGVYECAVTLAP